MGTPSLAATRHLPCSLDFSSVRMRAKSRVPAPKSMTRMLRGSSMLSPYPSAAATGSSMVLIPSSPIPEASLCSLAL